MIWLLFGYSLIIAASVQIVSIALPRLLPRTIPATTSYPGSYLFLIFSLPFFITFLINPVILFVVTYVIGKNVELSKHYVAVGLSLFLGGLIGGSVTYFLLPELFGVQWKSAFPDALSFVTTVTDFGIMLSGSGFSMLFTEFFGVPLAYLRRFRDQRNANNL